MTNYLKIPGLDGGATSPDPSFAFNGDFEVDDYGIGVEHSVPLASGAGTVFDPLTLTVQADLGGTSGTLLPGTTTLLANATKGTVLPSVELDVTARNGSGTLVITETIILTGVTVVQDQEAGGKDTLALDYQTIQVTPYTNGVAGPSTTTNVKTVGGTFAAPSAPDTTPIGLGTEYAKIAGVAGPVAASGFAGDFAVKGYEFAVTSGGHATPLTLQLQATDGTQGATALYAQALAGKPFASLELDATTTTGSGVQVYEKIVLTDAVATDYTDPGGALSITFAYASATVTTYPQNADGTLGTGTTVTLGGTGTSTPAVNNPPVIGGTVAGQATTDNASVDPFSTVTITDPDAGQTETATVTFTGANGTLADPNAATDQSTKGSGRYTVAGSAAQVQAGLRGLVFTPTAHEAAPGQAVTTGFALSVSDGTATVQDTTTTVVATAVASPITATPATNTVSTTDEAAAAPFSGVAITDLNAGQTETATVTLSSAANGTLADPNAASDGGTFSHGAYTVSGSATAVAAALDGLVFTPAAHEVAPGQSVSTILTAAISDTAGQTAAIASTLTATAVNDSPVIGGTAAGQVTTDNASVDPFSTVTITDPDAGQTETATVTFTAANGTLADPNAATDQSTAAAGSYTVAGSAAQVQADLRGLVFTPTAHEAAPGQAVTTGFALSVSDGMATAQDTITSVVATAVASPITATPATSTVATTDEAAAAPFSGVAITDPNFDQTETATVTLSSTANGTLADPNAASDGGTFSNDAYTVSGSATAVAAALDGLMFTPAAHEMAPGQSVSTIFTAAISDTTGQTAAIASTLTATAVNDPPVIGGTAAAQATTDYVPVKPFTHAAVTDPDMGAQDSLTITLTGSGGKPTDANGALSGTGLTKTGTGAYALAATSPANLTAELDALTFTPSQAEVAAGQMVTTSFTLTAAQGSANATDSTTTVTATALNYINGPANGHAILVGTPGVDVITAHGTANAISGKGGADIVNAGDGAAVVTLGDGNAAVTLGGSLNAVIGGSGNITVTGAPNGYTAVTLGTGNDTVQIGGTHDVILLGNGINLISGTQGMAFITSGSGNDSIRVSGSGSTINAGGGTNLITGGTGSDTFVLPQISQGFDTITGFTEGNGDILDLRQALAGTNWNHATSNLSNYLHVTDSNGGATLLISPNGTGGGTAVATLSGSGNLGLADLLSHHSLLTG